MRDQVMERNSGMRRAPWMRTMAAGLAAAVALSGCGALGLGGGKKGPSTPTVGNRVSILSNDNALKVDPAVADMQIILPAETANADWAQSGGNASKSMGHVALPQTRGIAWQASVAGNSSKQRLASPPVVSGGRLLVVDTQAVVTAFDAATGARQWATSIGSDSKDLRPSQFGGGVSVEGTVAYATSGTGDVAALNLTDGSVVWKSRPAGVLRGAPTVAFGSIYVMTQDNQLLALNAGTGVVEWQKAATLEPGSVFGAASPAAGQGTIIGGYSSGEVMAYRYENGRDLWDDALARTSIALSVALLNDVDADPVIDRGRVFALGQGGRMASYELVTGQRLWELSIAGISTPWVAGDWVFVVTDDARVLCVARATGRVRWIAQLARYRVETEKKKKDPIRWSGPILAGNRLILVNTERQMVELDPASGAVAASSELPGAASQPPIVAGGTLYLLDDSGRITAWR